jgi:hypothetical protein
MWEQYKNTFLRMQIMIAVVTVMIYMKLGHSVVIAAGFLLAMQLGAVVGAMWGTRLKRKIAAMNTALPLKPVRA